MALYQEKNTTAGKITVGTTDYSKPGTGGNFEVTDELQVVIKSSVNKATTTDTTPIYYKGESITITVTMDRAENVTGEITGITLTDTVADEVKFDESGVVHTVGTGGTISIAGQVVSITGLALTNDDNHKTHTFTITGTISVA